MNSLAQTDLENMLLLCGEEELDGINNPTARLRALIDGLITQRNRADALEQEVARLREALKIADMAINPPDRGGISLDHWNVRLKNATGVIRAALGNQQ